VSGEGPPRLHLDNGERRRLRATVRRRVRGTGFRAYCVHMRDVDVEWRAPLGAGTGFVVGD
jgi:hypothetical protein